MNVFSKRMLPHQVMITLRVEQALGERAHAGRRRGLVDEVEAGLAGLGDQRLDAVDEQIGRRGGRSGRCSRAMTSQKLHFFQ